MSGEVEAGSTGRPGWAAWVLLALAWFATLPVRPLLDPDEGRYAEIPREMLASGDWVTPRFDGLLYFEKPPLQYWATTIAYEVFGVSEWSSRLWSVGLAFACLPLTCAWVARLYGGAAARLALTALAVSPYFLIVGHINLLDGAFTFFLTATVLAFTLAQTSPARSPAERRWMLTAWAAAALAVLSKGIVVGVLAGAALGAAAVSASAPFEPLKFLLVFAAVTLAFFSASGSKLAPYILPMLPVLAAVTGAGGGAADALARHAARIGAALTGVVAVALLLYSARRNSYVPHEALLWTGAALLTALAAVVITWRARPATRTAASVATALAAILGWQCLMCAYSATPPARSARELLRAARPYIGAATPLYSVGQYRETVSPYLARTLQLVDYEGELHFGLEQEPQDRVAGGAVAGAGEPGVSVAVARLRHQRRTRLVAPG